MPWPPTPSAVSKFQSTCTTIEWGTDGMLNSWIVESLRSRDINEVIYIENGTGLRSIRIQLLQGREFDIAVIADQNFPRPVPGSAVTLKDPISNSVMVVHVVANEYDAARKREGRRTFSVVFDTNIEGGGNIANVGAGGGNDPGTGSGMTGVITP